MSYLIMCPGPECEMKRRVTANPLIEGWPEHCGQPMVFATTYDEENAVAAAESAVASLVRTDGDERTE